MDAELLVEFLGRSLPTNVAPQLRHLKAGDLWLACAYGRGLPNAERYFEERVIAPVMAAMMRTEISPTLTQEILQNLRVKFVEIWRTEQQGYSGRGDLAGWLYVCAVRDANRLRKRLGQSETLEDSKAMLLPSDAEDPEMEYLRAVYKRELQQAFRDALASLTSKERNLLRYHFLDKLSIDQIGALYRVHRATAARWINAARETLCERTRTLVCQRISLSEHGFERVIGLIASQIQEYLALEPH